MNDICIDEVDVLEESEPVSIPTYEEFCEIQDRDSDWWGWTLEGQSEFLMDTYGIEMKSDDIYFDLYYRTCSSDGRVYDQDRFIAYFHDQLMNASLTMTEVLREDLFRVRWSGGGRSERNAYADMTDFHGYTFDSGIFAGMDIDEMLEAEGNEAIDAWHNVVISIIDDIHKDILKSLECEDEYRKSTEEYEEWIKENYTP
jgi:hypothetical protein